MSQEQRNGEQPWVLAGGQTGHRPDEHVEVVADVEFFKEGVQQPTRQGETVRAVCKFTKDGEAAVSSPAIDLDAFRHPCRLLCARGSFASGSVAHGRHLRLSARLWERKRPPARRCRAGRVKDVACADALCVLEGAAGLCPSGEGPGLVNRGQEATGGAIKRESSVLPGRALTQTCEPLHVAPD